MSNSSFPNPRCPYCNTLVQSENDLPQGARVNCERCGEGFDLTQSMQKNMEKSKKKYQNSTSEKQLGRIRLTLGFVVVVMFGLALFTIFFINHTQGLRRQRDLPPQTDPGELVGLVAGGADCIIRLDGKWLSRNRIDTLTRGTPLAFFAESIVQTPEKLGFSQMKELVFGFPANAPFSSRFAAEMITPWNPKAIDPILQPKHLDSGEIYRVKVPGWPLSLDLSQVNPKQVMGMLAKNAGESSLVKNGPKNGSMAGELKEILAARIPMESPFWLVAKKGNYPKAEDNVKKNPDVVKTKNIMTDLLEAEWTVLGVWIEVPVDPELKAEVLRSEILMRLEIIFETEIQAQMWEKAREKEKMPGWKSIREKKSVSVQWKGFLESSWK